MNRAERKLLKWYYKKHPEFKELSKIAVSLGAAVARKERAELQKFINEYEGRM